MAIFHLSSQIIKRNDPRSPEPRSTVACASYRCGEDLRDELYGKTHSFAREDRVAHSEIIAPEFAKPWARDRGQLWNTLEAVERRKDAQLATEIEVGLPHELPKRLQRELLLGWIDEHFTKKGFVADFNIHHAPLGQPDNHHCHIMIPLRAMDPETGEFRKTKDRQDSRTGFREARDAQIELLRASWATHVNAALEKDGNDQRVDHRSHERRGITDVLPGIHVGSAGQNIEDRGGRSWRAEVQRQIQRHNKQILDRIKAGVVATYRDFTTLVAPAKKKQEPTPAPIAAKPEPAKPPIMQPPRIHDAEAEKRKKDAQRAAWIQQGGGGGVGG
jgi:hypothetical protein